MATEIRGYYDNGTAVVSFNGVFIETTLADSGDEVEQWLAETYRAHPGGHVAGLGVEPSPERAPGRVAVPVLQVCVGHRCLVFQILRAGTVPRALYQFLADYRFTFVGVGIHDDAGRLLGSYGLRVAATMDLRFLAANTLGRPDLHIAGLQALVRVVMGVQMEMPHHVLDCAWDAPELSDDQLKYACADAFASFEVGRSLYAGDYHRRAVV